jgi:hypothetical protein
MAIIGNLDNQKDVVLLHFFENQSINNIVSYFDNKFSESDIIIFINILQKDSSLLKSIIAHI